MKSHHASLALLSNATIWGLVWLPYQQLEVLAFSPALAQVVVYSLAIIAALLSGQQWRGLAKLAKQPRLYAIAVSTGVANVALVVGLVEGDVLRVMLLFYLNPLWSALLAQRFLGESISIGAAIRLVLLGLGACLVLSSTHTTQAQIVAPADLAGLLAGLAFATTNVLTRHCKDVPAAHLMLSEWLGCLIVASLVAFNTYGLHSSGLQNIQAWLLLGVLALGMLLGNLAYQYGMKRVATLQASMLLSMELLVAACSHAWFGTGVFSLLTAVGMMFMLASNAPRLYFSRRDVAQY